MYFLFGLSGTDGWKGKLDENKKGHHDEEKKGQHKGRAFFFTVSCCWKMFLLCDGLYIVGIGGYKTLYGRKEDILAIPK